MAKKIGISKTEQSRRKLLNTINRNIENLSKGKSGYLFNETDIKNIKSASPQKISALVKSNVGIYKGVPYVSSEGEIKMKTKSGALKSFLGEIPEDRSLPRKKLPFEDQIGYEKAKAWQDAVAKKSQEYIEELEKTKSELDALKTTENKNNTSLSPKTYDEIEENDYDEDEDNYSSVYSDDLIDEGDMLLSYIENEITRWSGKGKGNFGKGFKDKMGELANALGGQDNLKKAIGAVGEDFLDDVNDSIYYSGDEENAVKALDKLENTILGTARLLSLDFPSYYEAYN